MQYGKTSIHLKNASQKTIKEKLVHEKYKQCNYKFKNLDPNLLDIDENEWQRIFNIPINLKIENKIKEMQFKILHRIIGHNAFLFKIGTVQGSKQDFSMCMHNVMMSCSLLIEATTFGGGVWGSSPRIFLKTGTQNRAFWGKRLTSTVL